MKTASEALNGPKPFSPADYERMRVAMKYGEETEVSGIGEGIHRPFKIKFASGFEMDPLDCRVAVAKTVWSQFETKRYCKSMDARVTGPEREILAWDLDRVMGFDLVPPVVGREVQTIGWSSVQCWVMAKVAWELYDSGEYKYKKDLSNPWLHRMAAWDFITGQIDRHSANFMIDDQRRMYAIDNGYSFVKNDDRQFLKSSPGKALFGQPIHPQVLKEIASIDSGAVARVLLAPSFQEGEDDGVMKRLDEMKTKDVWEKMGGMW